MTQPFQPTRLAMLGVISASLMGCASLPWNTAPAASFRMEPVMRMGHTDTPGEAAYAAGKRALDSSQHALALQHFDLALTQRPYWPDALNGRVVALARLGRLPEAILAAQGAMANGSHSAELRANLARLQERHALLHAPAAPAPVVAGVSPAIVQLGAAKAAVAPSAVAPATIPQVAVAAQVPSAAPAAAPSPTLSQAQAAVVAAPSRLQWARQGAHILELRADRSINVQPLPPLSPVAPQTPVASNVPAVPVALAVAVSAAPRGAGQPAVGVQLASAEQSPSMDRVVAQAPLDAMPVLRLSIEFSNGAGRNGLAKETAQAMRAGLQDAPRLSNYAHFKVKRTQVQYRAESDREAAYQLARNLGIPAQVVSNPQLRLDVGLRVVLGQDAVKVAARSGSTVPTRG